MTERTITSTTPGPIALVLELAAGTIHIDCGPHNFEARVIVKTTATSGPSADAIRAAADKVFVIADTVEGAINYDIEGAETA